MPPANFRWPFGPSPQHDHEPPSAPPANPSETGKSNCPFEPQDKRAAPTKLDIDTDTTVPNATISHPSSSGISPSLEYLSLRGTDTSIPHTSIAESQSLESGAAFTPTMGCGCSKCCKMESPTPAPPSESTDGPPREPPTGGRANTELISLHPLSTPIRKLENTSDSASHGNRFSLHLLSTIAEEPENARDSVIDNSALPQLKDASAIPPEAEQWGDADADALLAPLSKQLEILKATTPEIVPSLHPGIKAKSHPKLLKQRLLPVGQFIVRKTKDHGESRFQREMWLWKFVAQNYWPLPADEQTYIHIHEMYHNAQFKVGNCPRIAAVDKKTTVAGSAPDNARPGRDFGTEESASQDGGKNPHMCNINLRQMVTQLRMSMNGAAEGSSTSQGQSAPATKEALSSGVAALDPTFSSRADTFTVACGHLENEEAEDIDIDDPLPSLIPAPDNNTASEYVLDEDANANSFKESPTKRRRTRPSSLVESDDPDSRPWDPETDSLYRSPTPPLNRLGSLTNTNANSLGETSRQLGSTQMHWEP